MQHHVRGKVARQAHVGIPEGTYEEEVARDGFAGPASHLYRQHPPVGWTRIEGDVRPRAYQATELGTPSTDWTAARAPFLEGDGVRLSFARLAGAMTYAFRNADADEILFVHAGRGRFESDFGAMTYETGHYLVVPRGGVGHLAELRVEQGMLPQQSAVGERHPLSGLDDQERGVVRRIEPIRHAARLAARILVIIPPLPMLEPAPPAMASRARSPAWASCTNWADGSLRGSAV